MLYIYCTMLYIQGAVLIIFNMFECFWLGFETRQNVTCLTSFFISSIKRMQKMNKNGEYKLQAIFLLDRSEYGNALTSSLA